MKTISRQNKARHCVCPGQKGSAVIVVLALIVLLMIFIAANARTVHRLTREVQLVEQRQLKRLATLNSTKNSVAITNASWTALPSSAGP